MKKVSDVFKSIRFAKGETRDKPHPSTDEEGHYTVGEKEYNQQLKHVKKMAMQEAKEKTEYDYEGDMARGQLQSIINNAQRVHDMLEDNDNLPEWVQSKITLAEDYISTVANYMMSEIDEEVEQIDEKNVPTSPEKWAQAKAQAKAKFDVYPSAYANGWAAKKYKEMGRGWKSVSEATENNPPFDPDPPKKKPVAKAGKYGQGYSTARHLARMAMQKQSEKMKKPIKEEEMSKKAQIVKSVAKKKKETADSFQKDPIISKSEVKM